MSESVALLVKELRLPAFGRHYQRLWQKAVDEGWSHADYLGALCEYELADRYQRRTQKWLKEAAINVSKTLATLKTDAETQVLFEFIAHRYESGSLIITANQPFSQWDSIFPDSMMTVAAVDRLIHHASIIELEGGSYRIEQQRQLESRK